MNQSINSVQIRSDFLPTNEVCSPKNLTDEVKLSKILLLVRLR